MIYCPAYGIPIMRQQCEAARGRFWLEKVCSSCDRKDMSPAFIIAKAPEPIISRVGGVLRSGPTIATALRQPVDLQKVAQNIHQNIPEIFPKPRKPRLKLPPGMTRAVARAMEMV